MSKVTIDNAKRSTIILLVILAAVGAFILYNSKEAYAKSAVSKSSSKKMSQIDPTQDPSGNGQQTDNTQTGPTTTPPDNTAPAVPGKPDVTITIKDGAICLEWNKVDNATGYIILRGKKKNKISTKPYFTTDKTQYADTSVKMCNTYYYRVYAYNDVSPANQSGQADQSIAGATVPTVINGEKSDVVSITVPAKPPVIKSGKITSSACTFRWKKVRNAKYYSIYRKNKKGDFRCIKKKVKVTTFTDKKLKSETSYDYKVCAFGQKSGNKKFITDFSNELTMTTSKKAKKVAYVGDSIMMGLQEYHVMKGKNRKMICKIGVSPYTFYNNTIMDDLLDYNPDTMFIMLGMNAIEGNPSNQTLDNVIKYYRVIIKECLKENPDMKIVMLPVSPVRKGSTANNYILNKYNKRVKEMADDLGVDYYDYRAEMKEPDGQLKKEYAESDGMHWKINGCEKFRDLMLDYEKENL